VINTCSALISFFGNFEEQVSDFYTKLSDQFPDQKDIFFSLSKQNIKHKNLVERVYREVITDAIEACFISDINEEDYEINTNIPDNITYRDALKIAKELEKVNYKFCKDAAQGTKGLLADITQAFRRITREKEKRLNQISKMNS
jgi:hypothetical protein